MRMAAATMKIELKLLARTSKRLEGKECEKFKLNVKIPKNVDKSLNACKTPTKTKKFVLYEPNMTKLRY